MLSMQIQHLLPLVFGSLECVTVVFLIWLYRYTRLKPVLLNAVWQTFAFLAAKGWLVLNARVLHTPPEASSAISNSLAMMEAVVGTALFIWMLLSLVRAGRPGFPSSRSTVAPGPAV